MRYEGNTLVGITPLVQTTRRVSLNLPQGVPSYRYSSALRSLRDALVSDDSPPDAEPLFFAEVARQTAAARAAGLSTGHTWIPGAWRALNDQVAQRVRSLPVLWFCEPGQWAGQGRQVLPGAEPYWVGGPHAADPAGARWRRWLVYDWTQTSRADGVADPSWSHVIPGGTEDLYDRLVASSPFPVENITNGSLGRAHGLTHGTIIQVDGRLTVGNRIHTLSHELAHHWLGHASADHDYAAHRGTDEIEAETASYLVVNALNLGEATTTSSLAVAAAYLLAWAGQNGLRVTDREQRWKLLIGRMTPAQRAADRILADLLAVGEAGGVPSCGG